MWEPPPRFDEYEIVKPLGRGGGGLVFVARDLVLERDVAVKFVVGVEPAQRAKLRLEARAAARIQHPNVATLYRAGELPEAAYLVSELVRGVGLEQLARPVAPERAADLARDIARGLAAAHRRGVLHRDIKPANVVLADSGEAKLVDFGLARLIEPANATEAATAATPTTVTPSEGPALVGTPYFRAPELWRGEPADARSDLYALGVVLYELLAGEGPFRHLTVKELARATQDEDARPLRVAAPAVPEGLATIVDRCVRRDRAARFASADDLLAALELLAPGRGAQYSVPDGNPYRGLRAYEAEHRALFFGRTRALALALERLRAESMLCVTGDSGVGKSSLCAAGIVPAIADGALDDGRRWLVARMVPGRAPMQRLAAAVAGLAGLPAVELERAIASTPGELGRVVRRALRDELGLLLYVDQMEELVTQATGGEGAQVAEAIAALADGVPGVRVLATARSDFLSRLAGFPALADRLPAALMLLAPMMPADVREAIVGPAAIKGTRFESDALVGQLVDSTLGAQGSLPLLQFTLAELWERREPADNVITETSLASVGGVAGSLARHADGVLVALAPEERVVARKLMLALVTVDNTRAHRTDAELGALSPLAPKVVESLVRGRLLVVSETPDGASYEIAHEALVQGWDTLARWLAEDSELRAARHRVEVAAAEWQRLGRRSDLVWSARQLGELDRRVLDSLTPREHEFLAASRRARRRTRWVRRGAIAVIVIAAGGAWGGAELAHRREVAREVADDVAQAEHSRDAARADARAYASSRRAAFDAWDRRAPADGEKAWIEAQGHAADARKLYGRASTELERALVRDPYRSGTRERYADLLLERALFAEDARLIDERDGLAARLALYDPSGERIAQLGGGGELVVEVTPPESRLELARYDGSERSELANRSPRRLGTGGWLLTACAPGRPAVKLSLAIARGETRRVSLACPASIPDGFAYLPAGDGFFGSSDPEELRVWEKAVALHAVHTDAYLIARHETTNAEWIAFLDALPPAEREQRRPHINEQGAGTRGSLELTRNADGTWQIAFQPADQTLRAAWGESLHYRARTVRADQDWRKMPVAGVSYDDMLAYARWLRETGRVPGARPCTEVEWERAARGTADWRYPHGDRLAPDDANIDISYGKDSRNFGPDEVGSHPASRSPFGVDDMAGNVWEWVASSLAPGSVARGGSYYFDLYTARVTNRETPETTYRSLTLGVRICATPASP